MAKYSIFISVGTQLPFDRLIRTVEEVFQLLDCELFFQVGIGGYKPSLGVAVETLSSDEYSMQLKKCDLFICHCGTGSLVSAVEENKPVICMPRLEKYGEHRNDHQYDASQKIDRSIFHVANDPEEIEKLVRKFYKGGFDLAYSSLINDAFVEEMDKLILEMF